MRDSNVFSARRRKKEIERIRGGGIASKLLIIILYFN